MVKLLTWALVLAVFAPAAAVHHLKTQDEYFHAPFAHDHLAVIVYDSKQNQFAKKLVDRLTGDLSVHEALKSRAVELATVDMSAVTLVRTHYDLETDFAFFLYINNQLQRFPDFAELASDFLNQKLLYADLLEETAKFVRGRFARINAPLKSLQEFGAALSSHKTIGVYLGTPSGFFFNQYTEFAGRHTNFPFFHAASAAVADQIYQATTNTSRPIDTDLWGIARDHSMLTDIDNKVLVTTDARKLMDEYTVFYEYERHPKLRDASHGDDIFFRLYNSNQKLVLYLYNDQSSLEELKQFQKAVAILPRIFIYSAVNTNDAKFGSFMQMFIQAGQNPQENKVYIFHATAAKMYAQAIPGPITADRVAEAVGRYFQHHKGLFSNAERAVVGDSDIDPETDEGAAEAAKDEMAPEPELVYTDL